MLAVLLLLGAGCQTMPVETTTKDVPAEETVVATNNPRVTLKTNQGDITLELFESDAPKTVENFLKLATSDFYDGTLFHRVIPDFMIQGGDPNTKSGNRETFGTGGPGYTFEDEINDQQLVRGILAMANAGPDTNGSQFFIVTAPATSWLDGKHTAFGRVTEGMDVVDAIEKTAVDARDIPVEDVVIEDVVVTP
jgi:cyclophilin family peptidyl-prolyl cis-trans isomerase